MRSVVLSKVFLRQLHIGGVGNVGAAALHRRLLALAGQENDASVLAVQNRAADALAAVFQYKVRAGHVLFNVGGDLRERLLTGVLLGDKDEVAVLSAQFA